MVTSESALWSLRKSIEVAEAARETMSGVEAPVLEKAIALRGVSFSYGEGDVLRDANATIPAGQLTVLIGPSGAGKTTVTDLIIGLIEAQAGTVELDGVTLARIDLRRWRQTIGYMPQEVFLLHDSVRTNVTLGDAEISSEAVETALRLAGAWDFVASLPQGMEEIVGERGQRISGGQRQRIALARAIVHRPKLLILDEATAALDPKTEASICKTLRDLPGDTTILAICHHGPLVDAADRVFRVQKGGIHLVASPTAEAGRAVG